MLYYKILISKIFIIIICLYSDIALGFELLMNCWMKLNHNQNLSPSAVYMVSNEKDSEFLDWLAIIIKLESDFNPQLMSHKNAIGLMQITPIAAKDVDRNVNVSKLLNPYYNIYIGTKYLSKLRSIYNNNWVKILIAYNAGHVYAKPITKSFELYETRQYVIKAFYYKEKYCKSKEGL